MGMKSEHAINSTFTDCLNEVATTVHDTAVEKGWWENERSDGEVICLIHSELSEALEAHRDGNQRSQKIPAFSSVEEELADAMIRILDYGKVRGYDLAGAMLAKIEFNTGRPYLHGGKKF